MQIIKYDKIRYKVTKIAYIRSENRANYSKRSRQSTSNRSCEVIISKIRARVFNSKEIKLGFWIFSSQRVMGRYSSRSRSPSRSYSPVRRKRYDEPRDRRRDRRSPGPCGLLVRNISLSARYESPSPISFFSLVGVVSCPAYGLLCG